MGASAENLSPLQLASQGRFLCAYGELDAATAPALRTAAIELVRDRTAQCSSRQLFLDLSGITFIDSSGLETLLELRDLCERRNVGFWIAQPSDPVRRLAALAGELYLLGDDFIDAPEPSLTLLRDGHDGRNGWHAADEDLDRQPKSSGSTLRSTHSHHEH